MTSTPENLVERLQNLGATDAERDRNMASIIADAEAGGDEHMAAVADWIAALPPAPPDPSAPRYEMRGGQFRPAFHDTNVLLELCVRVNGKLFTCREAIDPFMFEARFGDDAEFEKFIEYFVRSSCGRMTTDPESYRYFRSLVRVIRPGDQHDLARCADGWKANPYCDSGLIAMVRGLSSVTDSDVGMWMHRNNALGICSCRCHRADGSGTRAESLARMYGLPVFDEEMLDENGVPR